MSKLTKFEKRLYAMIKRLERRMDVVEGAFTTIAQSRQTCVDILQGLRRATTKKGGK